MRIEAAQVRLDHPGHQLIGFDADCMPDSIMWRWIQNLTFRGDTGTPSLRPITVPIGDPYREGPAPPLADRTADPRTLAEVLVALDEAGLRYRPRRHGFELIGSTPTRIMPVSVRHSSAIVPEAMQCGSDAPELLLDLALAMLPLFGPLVADVRFAGAIVVDGTRDRVALGEAAADRIQRLGLRVAARAPISFPILVDLARRMRQPR